MTIKFETDGAAFEDGGLEAETAAILRGIAEMVEVGATEGTILDANGNKIGEWTL